MLNYPFLGLPDELANLEIEVGEVVSLPDGNNYQIQRSLDKNGKPIKARKHGKRGGEKIFVEGGTKILSDHLKLPKDIVAILEGKKKSKSKTPATLAKKYDNSYFKNIKENKSQQYDNLSMKTAELMFAKNATHIDTIFEAQEEFKKKKGKKSSESSGDTYADKLFARLGGKMPKAQDGLGVGDLIDLNNDVYKHLASNLENTYVSPNYMYKVDSNGVITYVQNSPNNRGYIEAKQQVTPNFVISDTIFQDIKSQIKEPNAQIFELNGGKNPGEYGIVTPTKFYTFQNGEIIDNTLSLGGTEAPELKHLYDTTKSTGIGSLDSLVDIEKNSDIRNQEYIEIMKQREADPISGIKIGDDLRKVHGDSLLAGSSYVSGIHTVPENEKNGVYSSDYFDYKTGDSPFIVNNIKYEGEQTPPWNSNFPEPLSSKNFFENSISSLKNNLFPSPTKPLPFEQEYGREVLPYKKQKNSKEVEINTPIQNPGIQQSKQTSLANNKSPYTYSPDGFYQPLLDLNPKLNANRNDLYSLGQYIGEPSEFETQRGNTYGVDDFNPKQVEYFKYQNPGVDPNANNLMNFYQGIHKKRFGIELDTDRSEGAQNVYSAKGDKYGPNNAGIPIFQTQMKGEKEGRVTWEDFKSNPNIGKDYGLTESQMKATFEEDGLGAINFFKDPKKNTSTTTSYLPPSQGNSIPLPSTSPRVDPIDQEFPPIENKIKEENKPERKSPPLDPGKLIDGVQTGMLLSQYASAEVDNPYYSYSPQKAAYNRFDPINTLAQERAFNLVKENLRNSNAPQQVQQAQLSDIYANTTQGIGQVQLQNYQGNLQNNNQNTQLLNNQLNTNIQSRENANYRYATESAEGRARLENFKNQSLKGVMDIWRNREERDYNRNLISMMSRNYNIGPDGKPIFESGQGINQNYNQLDSYLDNNGLPSWMKPEYLNAKGREYLQSLD